MSPDCCCDRPVQHEVIVYGPVSEGDRTISGGTYPMSGYGWCCTCKQAGFGYSDEDEAGRYADAHIDGGAGDA